MKYHQSISQIHNEQCFHVTVIFVLASLSFILIQIEWCSNAYYRSWNTGLSRAYDTICAPPSDNLQRTKKTPQEGEGVSVKCSTAQEKESTAALVALLANVASQQRPTHFTRFVLGKMSRNKCMALEQVHLLSAFEFFRNLLVVYTIEQLYQWDSSVYAKYLPPHSVAARLPQWAPSVTWNDGLQYINKKAREEE